MTSRSDTLPDDLPYRSCVGIAAFNRQGKVWAGRRIQSPTGEAGSDYRWQMPQGGIDPDEDPLAAAKRELYEETGMKTVRLLAECADWLNYDLPADKLGIALKGKYRGQSQRWFAFRFEGNETEINISEPPDGSHPEFDAWEWKNLHDLPDLIVPFKRKIYERIAEDFSHLAD